MTIMEIRAPIIFLFTYISLAAAQHGGLCWKPGSNPFYGPPRTIRVSTNRVKLEWNQVFNSGPECSEVDFMVKSHPRFKPAQYKLSDFTNKGEREAILKIDDNADWVFQIIAREDKGPQLGIDYKYSAMATSMATDVIDPNASSGRGQNVLRQVDSQNYRKILNGDRRGGSHGHVKVVNTVRPQRLPMAFRGTRTSSTSTRTSSSSSSSSSRSRSTSRPQQTYRAPPTRSLALPQRRRTTTVKTGARKSHGSSASKDFNKCLPVLNNMSGFGHGSNMKTDRLVMNFIRHLNKQPAREFLEDFLKTKKTCGKKHEKGYLVQCPNSAQQQCCPTPWSGCGQGSCEASFAKCDGRCIPASWSNDGWPDCMDGSDEPDLANENGQPISYQLQCIQCSGIVLSSAYICSNSGQGITMNCLEEMMGENGGCNVCIREFLRIEN